MELIDRDELRKRAEAIIEDSASTKAWAILYEIDNASIVHDSAKDADCISRQAAVDALATHMRDMAVMDSYEADDSVAGWRPLAENVLKSVPSAQPEQQWIPCSERLPEKKQTVLVTVADEVQSYTTDDDWTGTGFWAYGKNVSAWMPYPEPWKGEQP